MSTILFVLIWSGLGLLVGIVIFACSLLTSLICTAVTGDGNFYSESEWAAPLALIISGFIIRIIVKVAYSVPSKTLIDIETKEELYIYDDHSLFFIDIKYWEYICFVLALLMLVIGPN
ncbi:hypothetical protein [Rubeoparvulum massiliense]|uniref:hypothetical protein n=1 Tax=Rubeoparvulum massiliense TaxID=1631346 RepID=UPI00065E33E3|nr:hypothetical protein [Rubeoparvulum massiliense]